MRRPRWRKMTWTLIVWCVLIVIWAIAGGSHAANQCVNTSTGGFLTNQQVQNACDTGAGVGVAIILFIGFVGFVFLSIIWLMSKPRGRDCPVCGEFVKRGRTVCGACGHDFAAAAHV